VAKAANISGATVSRVLSGRTDVSILPETRERVLAAAKALGYHPNMAARALMTGRTGIIGFWMSLDYSNYRGHVLQHMRTLLESTEFTAAVTDIDEEYTAAHSFDRALRIPVDGIIAFDTSNSVEAFARESERLAPNIPFVSMGAYWSESRSYVGIDLKSGADEAMAHLLGTGRRRISYLAPTTSDLFNSGPRYDSYMQAMNAASLEPKSIAVDTFRYIQIKEALTKLAENRDLPEAIYCLNDEAAVTASLVLQSLGVRIGEDVAILGFNGIEEAEHLPIPISTVRQPIEEMCALAVKFLMNQIQEPGIAPQQQILKPTLILRESTQSSNRFQTPQQ
jgi:DNA-binding LacI/PurR family transcriptional regulator